VVANVAAVIAFPHYEAIPFHFVWISLMMVYGLYRWPLRPALAVAAVVTVAVGVALGIHAVPAGEWVEMSEVPLMAGIFLVMVWYATGRERALAQAARAAEAERDFLRDAAHQLRTPITVARGHAELVQMRASDAGIVSDLGIVVEELANLSHISGRLLLLAASEHESFVHAEDFDAAGLIDRAQRRWEPVVKRQWSFSRVEGTVRADGSRLEAALDALIENAINATVDGARISVSSRAEGDTLVIEVSDGGRGMGPEEITHAFDRFFSPADGGRRGTGLGLAVVRAIAEAHGGSVRAWSAPGHGARFQIALPGLRAPNLARSLAA
jgi:signal transduction histidine kinase